MLSPLYKILRDFRSWLAAGRISAALGGFLLLGICMGLGGWLIPMPLTILLVLIGAFGLWLLLCVIWVVMEEAWWPDE